MTNVRTVPNKALEKQMKEGIDGRPLPLEATRIMTAAERIKAAVSKGYEILPSDVEYYYDLSNAFGIVSNPVFHGEEKHQANLIRRLKIVFNKKYDLYKMLADIQLVFGDFYQINKKFRRHIQVQRYEAVLKKAQIQKDTQLELDTLKQIDKLYNLQNENDPEEVTKKRLPRRKRSTNPEVFTQDD
jgi:hypothetical protein